MTDPAPKPRPPRWEDALRALLDDADAFGVLGFGADRVGSTAADEAARAAAPAAAGAGSATVAARAPSTPETPAPAAAPTASPFRPAPAQPPPPPATPRSGPTTVAPSPVAAAPDDSDASRVLRLADVAAECAACRRCALGGLRTNAVPGQGNPRAEIFFVGEAPGADEDLQGLAFVGAAGQLLTKMILAMGYAREDVFIANVLKCRPPGNRDPAPDEVAACRPFLRRQLEIVRPRVVCALGGHASRALLETEEPVGRLRGRTHDVGGIPAVVTYHPAYLLRAPQEKTKAWDDLKFVLKLLGKEPPARPKPAAGEPVA